MGIGAPSSDSYIEHQQKEQSYVKFIYQYPEIYYELSRDQPNGAWCPLGEILSRTLTKVNSLM